MLKSQLTPATRLILTLGLLPVLNGCTGIGMLLDAATTSAPPPKCTVAFNTIKSLPTTSSTGAIEVKGGVIQPGMLLKGELKRTQPTYDERVRNQISNDWLAWAGYRSSTVPCTVKTPLTIRMVLDEGTWSGEIPAESFPARPLFGYIWLELSETTLHVRLKEENGKTSYGGFNTGWGRNTTDKGVIAEVVLKKESP